MTKALLKAGIEYRTLLRKELNGRPVSASKVREVLKARNMGAVHVQGAKSMRNLTYDL